MKLLALLAELYGAGVQLIILGDEVRVRAPRGVLTEDLRQRLAEHKEGIIEALGDGTFPDTTLPDDLHIPADIPNTIEAFRACIDAQRVRAPGEVIPIRNTREQEVAAAEAAVWEGYDNVGR